ncbi:MAG: phosphoglucosamine mutase [Ruminococcaceae bacterium]|nr:phosphoglucosamine mutase [Oscillospiraceae bacterium]
MGRLFGSDGVRGVANAGLTCENVMNIGRAAAAMLAADGRRVQVAVGWDTRASSEMLAAALTAGLCSVGADVQLLGVVPTPAVAYFTRVHEADLGVAVAASHTPCEYNGLKLFDRAGRLSAADEARIEAILLDGAGEIPCPVGGEVGRVSTVSRGAEEYLWYLASTAADLRGMRVAVDGANGAACEAMAQLLADLGATPIRLNCEPNGKNINASCGVAQVNGLADYVKAHKCFGGIALDGDGERCVAVDEKGNRLDGDRLLAAFALDRKEKGALKDRAVVTTPLANLGFFRFCETHGMAVHTVEVGGAIPEEAARVGAVLGGDSTGALVLREFSPVADGLLTAVQLLTLCREKGCKLSAVGEQMPRSPQVMLTVKADDRAKAAYMADKTLAAHIASVNASLGGEGRVTVRPSETEPLIRVMVEGREFHEINHVAVALAATIKQAIGAYAL